MHPTGEGATALLIFLAGIQLFSSVALNLCIRGVGAVGSAVLVEGIGTLVALLLCRLFHVGS